VRVAVVALVAAAAVAAAWPAAGGAANECRGLQACIPVTGPWVLTTSAASGEYLISCPRGAIVGGLDALATTPNVRVDFAGQVGAPVAPGVTTTRNALVRGTLVGTEVRRALFQPYLGCVPTAGGGGRQTTSARAVVRPGAPLERYAKNVTVHPGMVSFGTVACPAPSTLVRSWSVLFFRTKKPPSLAQAGLVHARRIVTRRGAGLTVEATDALSLDVHAAVQVGVECAP
jgi:hypothetical protein